jgi:hypothetical protein
MANMELSGAVYVRHSARAVYIRWGVCENWLPISSVVQMPTAWQQRGVPYAKERAGDALIVADWVVKSKFSADTTASPTAAVPDDEKAQLRERVKELTEALRVETARYDSERGLTKALRAQLASLSATVQAQVAEQVRARMQAQESQQAQQAQTPPAYREPPSPRRNRQLTGTAAELLAKQKEVQAPQVQPVEQNRFNILELD